MQRRKVWKVFPIFCRTLGCMTSSIVYFLVQVETCFRLAFVWAHSLSEELLRNMYMSWWRHTDVSSFSRTREASCMFWLASNVRKFLDFFAKICRNQRLFQLGIQGYIILTHKFEISVADMLVVMNNFILLYFIHINTVHFSRAS